MAITSSVNLHNYYDLPNLKWSRKEEDRVSFQQGIDNLFRWSSDWQLPFNRDKCHVLQLGRSNARHKYTMEGSELERVQQEKDVGVIIAENLKPSLQCAKAAQKANNVLGQLTRGVGYRDKECFINLYLTYVRPHLEYAVAAWSPWNQGDKEVLEGVQRRAVKMVTNLKGKTYHQRLEELGLTTLEERRERGDLIMAYKVITGKDKVNYESWFRMCEGLNDRRETRYLGGLYNVERLEGRLEIRQNFWSVRVASKWNSLPDLVKSAKTVNMFKNGLDNWMEREKQRRGTAYIGGS